MGVIYQGHDLVYLIRMVYSYLSHLSVSLYEDVSIREGKVRFLYRIASNLVSTIQYQCN